jgi:hypothetical protein
VSFGVRFMRSPIKRELLTRLLHAVLVEDPFHVSGSDLLVCQHGSFWVAGAAACEL